MKLLDLVDLLAIFFLLWWILLPIVFVALFLRLVTILDEIRGEMFKRNKLSNLENLPRYDDYVYKKSEEE